MKAVDTSVVVAAFASWHELHDAARRVLDQQPELIEHCALEAYSVLTRLPAPHRAPAVVARDFISARFPRPFLRLSPESFRRFVAGLAAQGIMGGAAYDALIAATASANKAELVTCDRRATSIYDRFGVPVSILS